MTSRDTACSYVQRSRGFQTEQKSSFRLRCLGPRSFICTATSCGVPGDRPTATRLAPAWASALPACPAPLLTCCGNIFVDRAGRIARHSARRHNSRYSPLAGARVLPDRSLHRGRFRPSLRSSPSSPSRRLRSLACRMKPFVCRTASNAASNSRCRWPWPSRSTKRVVR